MKPVIAGIDGSQAAIAAALWAVDEAMGRSVPLRLVSVIRPTHRSADDYAADLQHAETSLRKAQLDLEATAKFVTIETQIVRGPVGSALVEASREAEMVCVGSVGIARYARSILGSAATELAERSHCPVAILRSGLHQTSGIDWIVVRMTDESDNDAVVNAAAWEAMLRRAPMLVLGGRPEELTQQADGRFEQRVQDWRLRHPGVRVYPITTESAIASFLRANHERAQLSVISGSESDQLAGLLGPTGHPLFGHPEGSVLVVRGSAQSPLDG